MAPAADGRRPRRRRPRVASHRSAARLHHLDGFETPANATIEVTRAASLSARSCRRRCDPPRPTARVCDLTVVDGIPCTDARAHACATSARSSGYRWSGERSRRRGGGALTCGALRSDAIRLHRPHQSGTGTLMRLLRERAWEGTLPATWFEELLVAVPQRSVVAADGDAVPDRRRVWADRRPCRTSASRPIRLGLEAHSRRFHFGPDAECTRRGPRPRRGPLRLGVALSRLVRTRSGRPRSSRPSRTSIAQRRQAPPDDW